MYQKLLVTFILSAATMILLKTYSIVISKIVVYHRKYKGNQYLYIYQKLLLFILLFVEFT